MNKHWVDFAHKSGNVIFMNRMSLERNVDGFKFTSKLSDSDYEILKHNLLSVMNLSGLPYEKINMAELSEKEIQSMLEQYFVMQDVSANADKSYVYISDDGRISVSFFGENHIKLSMISANQTFKTMYKELKFVDELLLKLYPPAYSEDYKFLTARIKNCGLGLSLQSLVHLPALGHYGEIESLASEVSNDKISIKPAYKVNDSTHGFLYMVNYIGSNPNSVDDAIEELKDAVNVITRKEYLKRVSLKEEGDASVKDVCFKCLGLLKYARMLKLDEALDALSYLKLGSDLKFIELKDLNDSVQSLMLKVMPASLCDNGSINLSRSERDIRRADLLREALKEV